jgi:manganese/zinc/iron transport system permease protein
MENLIEFLSLSDANVRYVVLGSMLLAASSAIVGTFTLLKKKALVGDAVAHSVLPGVCLAFILSGVKNPIYLIVGAFLTGWLSLVLIDLITSKSKIKEDTAIGLILSVFFGIGILMLTVIQKSGNAAQSGLDHFLFGQAASLIGKDLVVFGSIAVIMIAGVWLFFKEFSLIAFDVNFAHSIGFPVRGLELVLTTLTVLAVVTGIQAIGVVLMAAMLITPAAAARFWTDKLKVMIWLAAGLGAFSGLVGAYISYIAPAMPTGPWIVMIVSIIAVLSFFLAPKKGILFRVITQRKFQIQMLEENILKLFYQLGEAQDNYYQSRTIDEIVARRPFQVSKLKRGLKNLYRQGFLKQSPTGWAYTQAGKAKGQRVTKLHRLWELYLTEYLRIAPDHVHEDAETIEHIITPELERRLEEQLKYPKLDPHQSEIPYRNL